MRDTTPYDDDRAAYSRRALARLVLSDRAAGLADAAAALVVTRYDPYTGPGGRVSEAAALTRFAERLLAQAVVYERERGSSWEEIAAHLDTGAEEAEEAYSPEIGSWNGAFETPYRLDPTGRKLIPRLPTAAYHPRSACDRLDLWADLRLRFDDARAVSACLDADSPAEPSTDPSPSSAPSSVRDELTGRIRRRHLDDFIELVTWYTGDEPDDSALTAAALALTPADSGASERTYSRTVSGALHSLTIHLATTAETDTLSATVTGARAPDLRIRVNTLLTAFTPMGRGGL
ncbi:hypothetical protein ACFYT4_01370 [Streptomyces sp. NPDC004609]|uniref:hypothetical protein n=1 Tax=Streptomyces sp. NPDC004609 TaxID=3364704 RepID=UPI00369C9F44